MKKFRHIDFKLKTKELNSIFFAWKRNFKKDYTSPLNLSKPLHEIKWAGGCIGIIDLSTVSDLGSLSERKTDLLQREIDSLRVLKNEKISLRLYKEALELSDKENGARAQLNKFITYKIYGKHACFYLLENKRVGFVFRGEKFLDDLLEQEVRKVFPQAPTYNNYFLEFGVKIINQKSTLSLKDSETKMAA